jgi:hypothetical protein
MMFNKVNRKVRISILQGGMIIKVMIVKITIKCLNINVKYFQINYKESKVYGNLS